MIKTHILVATVALLVLTISLASTNTVRAQTPGFDITSTPIGRCISPGDSTSYLITVSSVDGFQGTVTLDDRVDPTATYGPTLSSIPSEVSLTSGQSITFNLAVSTTQDTPVQTYTITIDGLSGYTANYAEFYLTFKALCGAAGGITVPVNTITLMTPYISIAVTVIGIAALTIALVQNKRFRLP